MMNQEDLIKDLRREVYCRIQPSPIQGVGVFAIKDIPKGIMPFKNYNIGEFIPVDEAVIFGDQKIPEAVKKMVLDFCVFYKGKVWLLSTGMNSMNIEWYLNNSKNPNMRYSEKIESFITKRKIKAGEELTADYDKYSEK